MLTLILKASFILAVLLVFYKLFLEKESFFATNRVYLIGCLALAFVLPYVVLPEMINQQGYVSSLIEKVDRQQVVATAPITIELSQNKDLPKAEIQNEEATAVAIAQSDSLVAPQRSLIDWLVLIYYFGVAVFLLNFVFQVFSVLFKVLRSTDRIVDEHAIIINTSLVQEPCSFFNYIFINPESYDFDTYEQIIKHEKIHVSKRHSFDLLFSELAVILLWFNPLVWLWRKEVEKNIEYQTDDLLMERKAIKRDLYQMNLLKVATYTRPLTITTNYNQSLLKQRIMKMNAKKSNNQSLWKYAFMVPLIFAIILLVNEPLKAYQTERINELLGNTDSSNSVLTQSKIQEIGDYENDSQSSSEQESNKNDYGNSVSFDKPNYTDGSLFDNEGMEDGDNEMSQDTREDEIKALIKKAGGLPKVDGESESLVDLMFSTQSCRNLLRAVKRGRINDVREYLEETTPNCTYRGDGEPRSPLVAAARQGYFEIAQLLVAAEGDVEYHAAGDESPLMAAANGGHDDFVKLLVENGAKVNRKVTGNGMALLVAAGGGHVETVLYLLENGAEVDATIGGDGSALINAVRNRKVAVAKILLEHGADPYLNVPGDEYPMYHARQSGQKAMIELLKEYDK